VNESAPERAGERKGSGAPERAPVIDSWHTIPSEVRNLLSHTVYDLLCAAELSETISKLDDFFYRFAHLT
jgi:hypothetical protein